MIVSRVIVIPSVENFSNLGSSKCGRKARRMVEDSNYVGIQGFPFNFANLKVL